MIIAQLSFGTFLIIKTAMGLGGFLKLFFHSYCHGFICCSAKPLPNINLDTYKLCISEQWRPGGFVFTGLGMAFGKPFTIRPSM